MNRRPGVKAWLRFGFIFVLRTINDFAILPSCDSCLLSESRITFIFIPARRRDSPDLQIGKVEVSDRTGEPAVRGKRSYKSLF
jgi:hypothetical protein